MPLLVRGLRPHEGVHVPLQLLHRVCYDSEAAHEPLLQRGSGWVGSHAIVRGWGVGWS